MNQVQLNKKSTRDLLFILRKSKFGVVVSEADKDTLLFWERWY